MENNFEKVAMKVSYVSIVANVILSLLKLIAGIIAYSGAMISDAIHSASDVFSTIIVMVGIHMSNKESDKEHPYGHERMECVAAIILSTVLAITGLGIGYTAVVKIFSGNYSDLVIWAFWCLINAIFAVVAMIKNKKDA